MTSTRITVDGRTLTSRLADNATASDLLDQLPLTLRFRAFNRLEKIAKLPRPLTLDGTPGAADPDVDDIGYYAPSGDLVLYSGEAPVAPAPSRSSRGYYPRRSPHDTCSPTDGVSGHARAVQLAARCRGQLTKDKSRALASARALSTGDRGRDPLTSQTVGECGAGDPRSDDQHTAPAHVTILDRPRRTDADRRGRGRAGGATVAGDRPAVAATTSAPSVGRRAPARMRPAGSAASDPAVARMPNTVGKEGDTIRSTSAFGRPGPPPALTAVQRIEGDAPCRSAPSAAAAWRFRPSGSAA